MTDIDAVFQRIANDSKFADAVRTDPTNTLRPYRLDAVDLQRVDAALNGRRPTDISELFDTSTRRVGAAQLAAVGAVGAIVGAFVLGWSGALGGRPTASVLALDAVDIHMCSVDNAPGATTGVLHRGDRVWMIGRSGEQWLVIRDPQALTSPAWVRSSDVVRDGDTATLPEVDCATATNLASASVPVLDPSEPTTLEATTPGEPATTSAPEDTAVPASTSIPASGRPPTAPTLPTTPTTSLPSPTTPPATTAAPATTAPPTTVPDRTGPDVTVTADRSLLYSEGGTSCASFPQRVVVNVTVTDPTGPSTVAAVRWVAGTLTGAATPIGANRYEIGPVSSNHSGTIPMTITVSATDGAGNRTDRNFSVEFAQIAETCIG